MYDISFPAETVQMMISMVVFCILLPILFLWFYKKKCGGNISSFFIGAGIAFLIVFMVGSLFNVMLLNMLQLSAFVDIQAHPINYVIYTSITQGVLSAFTGYFILRFCRKNRDGKENALLFGFGQGALEIIAVAGSSYVTNLILAIFVNSLGLEAYAQKIGTPVEELAKGVNSLIEIPISDHYIEGGYLLLSLCMHTAVSVLIYMAMTRKEFRIFLPLSFLLHTIAYVPRMLYLVDMGNPMLLFGIAVVYVFVVVTLAYQIYHKK